MITLRITPVFLFSLIILGSCQKQPDDANNDTNSSSGTRLRMISRLEKARYTTYFTSFYYDVGGRLDNVVDSIWFRTDTKSYSGIAWPNHINYDQEGRIRQVIEREPLGDYGVYQLWFYNAENMVVKNMIVSELDKDTLTHTYSYDAQKRLVTDSVVDSKKKSEINYTIYRYDDKNNVVEWNHYSNSSGSIQNDLRANVVFDDHPNPFQNISLYRIPYWNDNSGLSKNNILKLTISNGVVQQYLFQYYDNGLPKSAIATTVGAQPKIENLEYQYD
jgi:YD repeat-containing protein